MTARWSFNLCGCSWGYSCLIGILFLLYWLDGLIWVIMYGCPVKVWDVSSWHTLLSEYSLIAQSLVVISNLVCQCSLLHMCGVYSRDVPSEVLDVHLVAMHFHYPVSSFLVFGVKGFDCVVYHQDEVSLLHWRFYWLLVVMFLHVSFSAVKKLLCYCCVAPLRLLSLNPFTESRIWNNSSSSDVLYIQASISISPKYESKSKTTSHCHLLLHDCTNVAV